MNKIKRYLVASALFLSTTLSLANTTPTEEYLTPHSAGPIALVPHAPNIDAKGYVLMDANSGKILASKNLHEKMQPASLTKLMTLFIVSKELAEGRIHLDDEVRISEKAWKQGGSRMFLKAGNRVKLRDLISGIIVASGNDSCVAVAEYIAGDEPTFANLMNQTAQQLGMHDSHFMNSTGLPNPQHYTTPYDLSILTQAIVHDFPQYYAFYKEKWIDHNNIRQPNRNRLLWRDPSVDGLKTGHTKEAGYCLISSADRDNMRLVSVVMGTPTDNDRSQFSEALLNWGYRFYKTHLLFHKNQTVTTQRVWGAKNRNLAFGFDHDVYVTVPAGSYSKLNAKAQFNKKLQAPITNGSTHGTLNVTLNNKKILSLPLQALADDPKGGFWASLTDHL
jgi:serine-type D-Ala-D-Ala carboxypeptidase (penicillin-binding protein 5/6)